MKICLIIQGASTHVDILKDVYKNDIPLIFSTWVGEEEKYSETDIVIFNELPNDTGVKNVMLQQVSTYNGLLKAKELGYEYAIKIRSDSYITNINKFLENDIDYNKLNFLYFLDYMRDSKRYQYFYDFCQVSKIDKLLKMWNFDYEPHEFSEQITTRSIMKINKDDISFIGKLLSIENDIIWLKNDLWRKNDILLSELDKKYYIDECTL